MGSSVRVKVSGFSLVVGAILFAIHIVLRSLITAGIDPVSSAQGSLWVPVNALGVIGAILVLLGLPSFSSSVAAETGWLGLIGGVLVTLAWLFFGVFLSLYALLLMPWLAENAPALVAAGASLPNGFVVAFMLSLLAWLIGTVLAAIPFWRGQLRPRWIGYLLPFSGIWMLVGNLVIAPSGPASNLAINLISNLGPVLLVAALGYLGFQMWKRQWPVEQS